MNANKIHEFWNEQASLAERAGSQDLLAKEIEVQAIKRHIRNGARVCEFGCGNGVTAIALATEYDVRIDGFDFAAAMVEAAEQAATARGLSERLTFAVANVLDEPELDGEYDTIYTERMLINLPDWPAQERAIRYLAGHLRPGGRLLLCENSMQGLERLNSLRLLVGLLAIKPPWHNCYLDDTEIVALQVPELSLIQVEPFSATYYFLSRVINAKLADDAGVPPAYDAPINRLALQLPPFSDCAQGKLWVFERKVLSNVGDD